MSNAQPKLSPIEKSGGGLTDRKLYTLLEDWTVTVDGFTITVPAGRITDFSSVPRCLQWLLSDRAVYSNASILHDWLYFSGDHDHETCDAIFHSALKDIDGSRWFDRQVMFFVLLFMGGAAYKRHRTLGHPFLNKEVFALLLTFLFTLACHAQLGNIDRWDQTQFSANQRMGSIKSGAVLTNITFYGTIVIPGYISTNSYDTNQFTYDTKLHFKSGAKTTNENLTTPTLASPTLTGTITVPAGFLKIVGGSAVAITNTYTTTNSLNTSSLPTSGQGVSIITNTYTATSTANQLEIRCDVFFASDSAGVIPAFALFIDSGATASDAHLGTYISGAFEGSHCSFVFYVTPSDTGAHKYIIRAGPDTNGTNLYVNSQSGGAGAFGNREKITLTVREYAS